jgi:hypothetical protein
VMSDAHRPSLAFAASGHTGLIQRLAIIRASLMGHGATMGSVQFANGTSLLSNGCTRSVAQHRQPRPTADTVRPPFRPGRTSSVQVDFAKR